MILTLHEDLDVILCFHELCQTHFKYVEQVLEYTRVGRATGDVWPVCLTEIKTKIKQHKIAYFLPSTPLKIFQLCVEVYLFINMKTHKSIDQYSHMNRKRATQRHLWKTGQKWALGVKFLVFCSNTSQCWRSNSTFLPLYRFCCWLSLAEFSFQKVFNSHT